MERRRPLNAVFYALEAAVVILCIALIWQNVMLRRQLAGAAASARRNAPRFAARDPLPSAPVVDLNGRTQTLDFNSSRTIVAIVDPECGTCAKAIADARDAAGVLLVSTAAMTTTRDMASRAGVGDRTYLLNRPDDPRWRVYPQIIVVDRGTVARTCASIAECR